jgi:hypothetical protein
MCALFWWLSWAELCVVVDFVCTVAVAVRSVMSPPWSVPAAAVLLNLVLSVVLLYTLHMSPGFVPISKTKHANLCNRRTQRFKGCVQCSKPHKRLTMHSHIQLIQLSYQRQPLAALQLLLPTAAC